MNSNLVDTSPCQVCSAGRKGTASISFMTHINPGGEAVLPPLVCSVMYLSSLCVHSMCKRVCECVRVHVRVSECVMCSCAHLRLQRRMSEVPFCHSLSCFLTQNLSLNVRLSRPAMDASVWICNSPGATRGLDHTQLLRGFLDPNLSLPTLALLPTEPSLQDSLPIVLDRNGSSGRSCDPAGFIHLLICLFRYYLQTYNYFKNDSVFKGKFPMAEG